MKQDSLDRSKTDLKKLRRKSQGKSSSKYEVKENEVRRLECSHQTPLCGSCLKYCKICYRSMTEQIVDN